MRSIAAVILFSLSATAFAADRVETLLSRMTLEEKLGQLTQFVPDQKEMGPAVAAGHLGSVLNSGGAAKTNELQRAVIAGSRLKIPLLIGYDVIHGYRTIFPIPLAIASSWDPTLAELSAGIAAREARAAGIHWTFAPMVDIARDPRWGRIAEGAGEDPLLGSAMAAAYVRGFQQNGLLACAKHFAAYGAAEAGRDYGSSEISERILREVYLPPFHAAVGAGAASLMSAFNTIDGVPATANKRLLTDILRKEWNFRGFVVSDWSAIAELIPHGVAATKEEAAAKAITAGVDMDMVDAAYPTLAAVVRDRKLPQSVIDTAVRRVLRAKEAAGLFDEPFTDETLPAKVTLTSEHRAAARRVAQHSMVLLKNDGALLPLSRDTKTIALIGPLADAKADMLGTWSAEGKAEETSSVLEGMRAALPASTRLLHERGTNVLDGSDEEFAKAIAAAGEADVVIAILGENRDMSGEAASRTSLDLPGRQPRLLEALVATGKPLVLVIMAGRPLSISWAAQHVPSIVLAWFLGTEGGHAIVDVLFGEVNPSGKLPVTMPRTVGQVPIYHAQLRTGRPANVKDKFTSKYLDVPIGPLYPFGHGLSYTRFEYGNLALSAPTMRADGRIIVSAEVRNIGNRAGDEIVQMYIADPVASVARPVKELKGFQRITLGAGESKRVEFPITRRELEFWLDGRWVAEPGAFRVWIAPSSEDGLETSFRLARAE